jgi:RHS repeat-associated protein
MAELDGNGNVLSTFLYGTGNAPDALLQNGVTYRLIKDHLGSVRWVLNAITGEVAQHLDYDAFGRVTLDTNPGFQPFGFAGGLYDSDTGLVHSGAREYDPNTGRWTSKDPVRHDSAPTPTRTTGGVIARCTTFCGSLELAMPAPKASPTKPTQLQCGPVVPVARRHFGASMIRWQSERRY